MLLTRIHSASSATIVRFPYLHSLTDIDDFLFSTVDVAIWSTVETGIGITASAVATLRPLLRTFFSGSSAPGHGTSANQWPKSSNGLPNSGYIRRDTQKGEEDAFEMQSKAEKRIGVTTVINHQDDHDSAAESSSNTSGSVKGMDVWNNHNTSQTNLAESGPDLRSAWNITVKKTVVQTRGDS